MSIEVGAVIGALRHLLMMVGERAVALGNELPQRQYVTTGGAVYDCAQVSVSANSITTGIAGALDAGNPVNSCPPGWNVLVELAIVRGAEELPTGTRGQGIPKVECIEADTTVTDMDAATLTDAIETIAGPGWDQYGTVPASLQFGEVQGGLTAVVLTCTLNLWAIPVDLGAVTP